MTPRRIGLSLLLPLLGRHALLAAMSSLRHIDDAMLPLDDDAVPAGPRRFRV